MWLKASCTYNNYITAMNRALNKRENEKESEVGWMRKEKRKRGVLFEIYTVIEWKFLMVYIVSDVIGKSLEKDKIPL